MKMIQKQLLLIFCLIFGTDSIERASHFRSFDLTYPIKTTDPVFPGLISFNFTEKIATWKIDEKNQSYFQSLNIFTTTEHFGTHIDAPYHGSSSSWTLTDIPFDRLVSIQGLIVDVSKKVKRTTNYEIQINDLNEKVLQQATGYFVLLFYTGKSKAWPDQDEYAGGSTRDELDFPGLSDELAEYLVEKYSKKLVGVGIDTLSSKIFSFKLRFFFFQTIDFSRSGFIKVFSSASNSVSIESLRIRKRRKSRRRFEIFVESTRNIFRSRCSSDENLRWNRSSMSNCCSC